MLGGQRPYLDKTGRNFEKEEYQKSSKESQNKIFTCICCFKKGHTSKICFSRKKAKIQKVKNFQKKTNPKGPKKIWVPKVKIFSYASVS